MIFYQRCLELVDDWQERADELDPCDPYARCASDLEDALKKSGKPGRNYDRIGILCEHCGCETNPYYWRTYIAGHLKCWSCGKPMEFTDVPQALTERLLADRTPDSSREAGGGALPDHLLWHVGACQCGTSGVHVNTVTGLCRECTDAAKWRNVRDHINAIDAMSTGDDIRNVLLLMLERMEAI